MGRRVLRVLRVIPQQIRWAWRSSLQVRTVLATLGLSGVAVAVIGLFVTIGTAQTLWQGQLDRVLGSSNAATVAAQRVLSSSDATDRNALQSVLDSASTTVQSVSGSSLIAVIRAPGQANAAASPQGQVAPRLVSLITADMRNKVAGHPGGQFWQPVGIPNAAGDHDPGVVVGTELTLPGIAGRYELYIGYSFADTQATLRAMQITGSIGAGALLLVMVGVALGVVWIVVGPIRAAAATSRRIAAGDLDARMAVRGSDELATLARNFNQMTANLRARIVELGQLSQMQQRFVSDVSHELRTPLTTIRLGVDTLSAQRDEFTGPTLRTVELLHTQTGRFEALLADLLEISRYDAGSADLHREPTDLIALCRDIVEGMQALARLSDTPLQVVVASDPGLVSLDPRRVGRVIRNLVGNAIEHGEGKPVVLTVGSSADAVAVTVRDHGMGMRKADTAHVFDRFWRADPSRKRTFGGTGLGLAISREDAAAHGGRLEVWSRLRSGSVFRLTVPREQGAGEVVSPLPLVSPRSAAGGVATAGSGATRAGAFEARPEAPKAPVHGAARAGGSDRGASGRGASGPGRSGDDLTSDTEVHGG